MGWLVHVTVDVDPPELTLSAVIRRKSLTSKVYGPVPVAFFKLQAAKNTAILIGALPT